MKLLDLFAGIGGFSLGLESTGYFKTIAFVEKDEFCQKVLKKNFKNIPIESEVRDVKGKKYEADIITAGFPCQPFSIAGKRKGTNDDRFLWDETIRIVRETKPRWFIGENVEGIINIQEGMVLRQVQNDLEKEDFQVQCLVIPAAGIGAWHQRKRVWIVANSKHYGPYRQKRNETIKSSNKPKKWLSIGDDKDVPNTDSIRYRRWSSEGCTNREWSFLPREQEGREMGSKTSRCDVDVSYPNNKRCKEFNLSSKSKKSNINSRKYDKETENKTWWQTQFELRGIPAGVSYELDKDRKDRIKALGNTIVPQIARELGLAIAKAEGL